MTAHSTLTQVQLDAHYSGIGGSMAPAILGLDPYRTPLDAYNELIDPASRPDLSDNEAVQAGIILEPAIRQWTADKLGIKVQQSHQTLRHPKYDFMVAHIDGRVVGQGQRAGLEIKNRGFFRGKEYGDEGTDQVMDSELIQCTHYLAVTGWDRWYLGVCIGGQRLRVFTIERDEGLIATLIGQEQEFWEKHVIPRVPPAATTLGDLRQLYPQDTGAAVTASPDAMAAASELKALKAQIKDLSAQCDQLEFSLKAEMEDAAVLTDHTGRPIATWKTQTSRRLDTTAIKKAHPDLADQFTTETQSRVLRLK